MGKREDFSKKVPKDMGGKKSRRWSGNQLGTHRGTSKCSSVHLLSKSDEFWDFSRTPPRPPFLGLAQVPKVVREVKTPNFSKAAPGKTKALKKHPRMPTCGYFRIGSHSDGALGRVGIPGPVLNALETGPKKPSKHP